MPAPAPLGKACKVCGVWKPLTEFSPQATGALGHKARCKPCFNAGVIARKIAPPPPPDPVILDADGNPVAKRCKTCGEMKPLGEFSPAKLGLFGRVAHCKACNNAAWKAGYTPKRPPPPPVPLDAEGKPVTKRCRGCGETKPLDAFQQHPGCSHGRHPRCRACLKAQRVNPKPRPAPVAEGFRRCSRCGEVKPHADFHVAKLGRHGRQAECKPCHVAVNAGWREKRPGYNTRQTAQRRATLLSATLPWLTHAHHAEMAAIYEACALPLWPNHEVDHVLPLAGRSVRGLHAPGNLAIVDAPYNRSKGNRVVPATERAEAPEFGRRWDIWNPAEWWDCEWFLMGFG